MYCTVLYIYTHTVYRKRERDINQKSILLHKNIKKYNNDNVFNIENNKKMFIEHQIILEWFLWH